MLMYVFSGRLPHQPVLSDRRIALGSFVERSFISRGTQWGYTWDTWGKVEGFEIRGLYTVRVWCGTLQVVNEVWDGRISDTWTRRLISRFTQTITQ